MFLRTLAKSGILRNVASPLIKPQMLAQSAGYKTKTVGLFGNEVKECEVEVSLSVADTYLNPSSQHKIYPSSMDEYHNVPVVIDGEEVTVPLEKLAVGVPVLPNLVYPGSPLANDPAVVPDQQGDTMAEFMLVHFAENMPTREERANHKRDFEKYPHAEEKRVIESPKFCMYIFPDWWFKPFFPKTGVSGPYLAATLIPLAMISKEFVLVCDHSVPVGLGFIAAIIVPGMHMYGKKVKTMVMAQRLKLDQWYDDWREGGIKLLNSIIGHNNKQIELSKELNVYYEAMKENVHLQREATYRKRLLDLYNEARRKLDMQAALDNAKEQFIRRHMVNWIIDNVNKSLTPDKEKMVFDQCLTDLKILAEKRAGVV